jgi:hypothetical protein
MAGVITEGWDTVFIFNSFFRSSYACQSKNSPDRGGVLGCPNGQVFEGSGRTEFIPGHAGRPEDRQDGQLWMLFAGRVGESGDARVWGFSRKIPISISSSGEMRLRVRGKTATGRKTMRRTIQMNMAASFYIYLFAIVLRYK